MVTLELCDCVVVRLHFCWLYLGFKNYTLFICDDYRNESNVWIINFLLLLLTDPGAMLTYGLGYKNAITAALCLLTLMFNKGDNNRCHFGVSYWFKAKMVPTYT